MQLQKRLFVPYESIPEVVDKFIFISRRQKLFNHPGVDAKGILRAVIKNIKNLSK